MPNKLYVLIFSIIANFAQLANAQALTYQSEVTAPGMPAADIIRKVNNWALNNNRNFSSAIQNIDSSGLAVSGSVSVFLDYQGSHNRQTSQDNYNYQLLIKATTGQCNITLRNYINQLPNSQPLTTYASRLQRIDNMDVNAKRKKVLKKFAADEYTQLDTHAAHIYTSIKKLLEN